MLYTFSKENFNESKHMAGAHKIGNNFQVAIKWPSKREKEKSFYVHNLVPRDKEKIFISLHITSILYSSFCNFCNNISSRPTHIEYKIFVDTHFCFKKNLFFIKINYVFGRQYFYAVYLFLSLSLPGIFHSATV